MVPDYAVSDQILCWCFNCREASPTALSVATANATFFSEGVSQWLALETGDLDAGLIWAGQVQGLIHDIPNCRDLIERIVSEAGHIIACRLAGLSSQHDLATQAGHPGS